MSELPPEEPSTRAIVLVVDGCGVGAAPDAVEFGDSDDCNTLANVAHCSGALHLPNFAQIGLGNIIDIEGVPRAIAPSGLYGKLREVSNGKDTQTGHWEMMGVISPSAFPTYPQGFPPEIIDRFIAETGCRGVLCNKPASGTDILNELGEEHQKTGFPIVYTSADSVFQIACHVETVPLPTLYRWCEVARGILQGLNRVGRVIARPFTGTAMKYDPMTLWEFQERFRTEEDCQIALSQMRWSKGFVCPKCGHDVGYQLTEKRRMQCACCRHQVSLTAGTIFHKTRVPLRFWFWMIYMVAHDKGGASALRLSKELKLRYATVWLMLHKIRAAMSKRDDNYKLSGSLEIDQAFFGRAATTKMI